MGNPSPSLLQLLLPPSWAFKERQGRSQAARTHTCTHTERRQCWELGLGGGRWVLPELTDGAPPGHLGQAFSPPFYIKGFDLVEHPLRPSSIPTP